MKRQCYHVLCISLAIIFLVLLGSCDLFLTAYTIQVRLGHQNPDDPNPVTFSITDLPPKSLDLSGWFPSGDSFHEYTARLSKASDFTIVVETSDGTLYTQKITVQEGYRYSIYYQNAPAYNYIVSYGEPE